MHKRVDIGRDHVIKAIGRNCVDPLLIGEDENYVGTLGHNQPFTAPPIDWTIYLFAKMMTGTVGKVSAILANAMLPQSTLA